MQPLSANPHPPQKTPPDLILQYVEFIDERACRREMTAMDMLKNAEVQHVCQSRRVSAVTRNFERLLRVCECGFGIAEQQQSHRSPGQNRRAHVLTEPCREMPMLARIIERDRAVEMRSPVCDIAGMEEGQTHEAMPDHERRRRALFFRNGQKLHGELTHHVPVECDKVCDPQTVKNGEQ